MLQYQFTQAMAKKASDKKVNEWKVSITFRGETIRSYAQHELLLRVAFSTAVKRKWKEDALLRMDDAETLDGYVWHGMTLTASGLPITYEIVWRGQRIRRAASILGQLGGAAGKGSRKVRGDSEYYRRLQKLGADAKYKKKDKPS